MKIKIKTKGEILNPKDDLRFIFIDDDRDLSGGYYVFLSDELEYVEKGYYVWVEEDKLEKFIKDNGWNIKWLALEKSRKYCS